MMHEEKLQSNDSANSLKKNDDCVWFLNMDRNT